jgi:hypothetical protein
MDPFRKTVGGRNRRARGYVIVYPLTPRRREVFAFEMCFAITYLLVPVMSIIILSVMLTANTTLVFITSLPTIPYNFCDLRLSVSVLVHVVVKVNNYLSNLDFSTLSKSRFLFRYHNKLYTKTLFSLD